jgi:tetratricopeptide (TPR) repeat protein
MKTKNKTFLKGILFAAISAVVLVQGAYAQGGRAAKKDEAAAEAAGGGFDQKTGAIVQAAYDLLSMDKFAEARTKLGELNLEKLSPNERKTVEQMFFNLDISEEKYDSARKHMEAAIASGGMNDQDIAAARYQLAQLYFREEKWAEGTAGIEAWLKTATNPNGGVFYLLASGYYRMDKLDSALTNAKKAVELTDNPQEGWLSFYASLLNQKEQFKDGIPIAKRLINMKPDKRDYWLLLASFYGQLEDMDNALVVMQLAQHAGLLTQGSELKNLASYMQIQNMPYRAAELLTKAIDDKKIEANFENLDGLANAWIAAAEYKKALPIFDKASSLANNGNTLARIGEVNMQIPDWAAASEAFEKALNKGGLRDTSNAQYLLGYSLYQQGKLKEAKTWFERASSSQKDGKSARAFIQVIDSKLR